ncbi:MAG: MerR family transcriptional regulator [Lachnospira sp.]
MYTIGQISEMFNIPVSTLRYYDKEGLFPAIQRSSGIRQFSDAEISALKLIECLKKSGLEIRDIKQFMEWCQEGSKTYELRKQLFERQRANVEKEIAKMQQTLDMLTFKCWYYDQAIKDGNEKRIKEMLPDKLPKEIQKAYDNAMHGKDTEFSQT